MATKTPSTQPPVITPGLRKYLYTTAAVTGAMILVVEILGAKMLAPYLGTSHFVWTAQIAVTLVSLAIGYWFGGLMADRSANLIRLYGCIVGAGAYLLATIGLVEPVTYALVEFDLAVASLLASFFLFFLPLTLLAAVGPFLVRVMAVDLKTVGGQAGRISAVSTAGSVAGTLLIGYVVIPFLPNSITMFITGLILLLLPAGYIGWWGSATGARSIRLLSAVAAAGLLAGGLGWVAGGQARWERMVELHRQNSNFGLMQVVENQSGTRRFYLNDFLTQNTYDPQTGESLSMFTYMLHGLALAYQPAIDQVLCIGLGIGIVPMKFIEEGAGVDVVEINPRVVPLAIEYFGLQPEGMNLIIGDGRAYLHTSPTDHYDAIILDAFLGDSSPSHLMTVEAFSEMAALLKPGGVLVVNSFGALTPGKDFFISSLHQTLQSVFQSVRLHTSGNGNVFFVASERPDLEMVRPFPLADVPASLRQEIQAALGSGAPPDFQDGLVLTDDYNPIEFFDAQNREFIRRHLALFMRDL